MVSLIMQQFTNALCAGGQLKRMSQGTSVGKRDSKAFTRGTNERDQGGGHTWDHREWIGWWDSHKYVNSQNTEARA